MATNGSVARLPRSSEIPAPQLFDGSPGVVRTDDWEAWIGAIVTAMAYVSEQAVQEIAAGGLDPNTRSGW